VSNYDGAGGGNLDLVSATVRSVNAAFARLEVDGVGDGDGLAGAERVAGMARRLGISFPTREEIRASCGDDYLKTDPCQPADDTPAIALGAKEVSPFDMASAYATFANDGVRVDPTVVVRVTDGDGRVLYRARPEWQRVLPSGVARGVTAVLQQAIQRGTATRARIDRPAAAKTGTSQSWRDAWLAGYVPQLTAVVWVGNPIPVPGEGIESMTPANGYPYRIVGGTLPAMIWHAFMTDALSDVPTRSFKDPPTVMFRPPLNAPEEELLSPPPPGVAGAPYVVGKVKGIARLRLRRAGYAVSEIEQCAPGDVGLHRVWNQDPPPGSPVERGQTVTIWYQPGGCD
jgi:membrane peptidoglycan carboxypeptidase